MIGDRTHVAEVYVFGAIMLLGATAYLLTLAAKSASEGRERHRREKNELTIEAMRHHERALELEAKLRTALGNMPASESRTIVAPAEGPAEVQEPGAAGDA